VLPNVVVSGGPLENLACGAALPARPTWSEAPYQTGSQVGAQSGPKHVQPTPASDYFDNDLPIRTIFVHQPVCLRKPLERIDWAKLDLKRAGLH